MPEYSLHIIVDFVEPSDKEAIRKAQDAARLFLYPHALEIYQNRKDGFPILIHSEDSELGGDDDSCRSNMLC